MDCWAPGSPEFRSLVSQSAELVAGLWSSTLLQQTKLALDNSKFTYSQQSPAHVLRTAQLQAEPHQAQQCSACSQTTLATG